MYWKTSSAKRRPFCLGLNVLIRGSSFGLSLLLDFNISQQRIFFNKFFLFVLFSNRNGSLIDNFIGDLLHWICRCKNCDRIRTNQYSPYDLTFNLSIPHYCDVMMGTMASQITSLTIVYSTVHSGADQRTHQSSASLAFVRGIHRRPVNSPHKWPVTRKMYPFDDVIM